MQIRLNGEVTKLQGDKFTIAALLDINRVESPEMVSVQRNGDFVDREKFDSTVVADNDEIEFLYFMGGGAR